jgi:hypothetical protein
MSDLNEYAAAKAAAWVAIVQLAYHGQQNGEYGLLSKADERKIRAINDVRQLGMTQQEIIGAGQTEILSRAARNRRNGAEPQRVLSWRVSRSLADAIYCENPSPDAEECTVARIARVCEIDNSEDLWEFIKSVLDSFDDTTLKMWAGEADVKKKARKASAPKQQD